MDPDFVFGLGGELSSLVSSLLLLELEEELSEDEEQNLVWRPPEADFFVTATSFLTAKFFITSW